MGLDKKSLAKVFGPAVLLTAALALPVESLAAKPANAEHGNRGKGHAQRVQVQRQKQVVKRQGVQRQVRQQAAPRQKAVRQQAVRQKVVRQPVVRQPVRKQVVVRQPVVQRQVVRQPVVVQRQVVRQPVIVQRQRVPVYDNRYYNNQYRNNQPRRGGADRSVIAADGYLEDTGSCLILRGHQGQYYSLVGDTRGLNDGDHVRLLGQLFYERDGRCGGEVMEIRQVQTLWEDDNHRRTYYDHLRDGSFYNYSDRYGDRYYYDDDRY